MSEGESRLKARSKAWSWGCRSEMEREVKWRGRFGFRSEVKRGMKWKVRFGFRSEVESEASFSVAIGQEDGWRPR